MTLRLTVTLKLYTNTHTQTVEESGKPFDVYLHTLNYLPSIFKEVNFESLYSKCLVPVRPLCETW